MAYTGMLPTEPDTLRDMIQTLEAGRRKMMDAPKNMFDWMSVNRPECGAPACCWGFAASAGRLEGAYRHWSAKWNIVVGWSHYCFWMTANCGGGAPNHLFDHQRLIGLRKEDRDAANDHLQRFINRLRHRLATIEVEHGEWGRPLKARDMPVGSEREQLVHQKLEAELV